MDENFQIFNIKLVDIENYCGGGGQNELIRIEGSSVFESNHIISCEFRYIKRNDAIKNDIEVKVLCLQSSQLHSKQSPHEINLIFERSNLQNFKNCKCSCVTGQLKCKHIVASLLYLYQ